MLQHLIQLALKQKGLILLLIASLVVYGLLAFWQLPIDAFPDVTNVQVEIVGTAEGLSALEIERTVTSPLEMAMKGLPDATEIRSVTKYGITLVTVVFEDKVDIYFARQLVNQRIQEVSENLPSGIRLSMGPLATAMGEIYQYTLQGALPKTPSEQVRYLTELRTVQEWVIAPLLKSVTGINEINSFGGYFKQYQVIVDPEKLSAFHLTLAQVCMAIEKNNQNVGGNILDRHSEQLIVHGVGLLRSEKDIEKIVLKVKEGTPVTLAQVAQVRIGEAVRQGAALMNGDQEVVGGIVMMLRGGNSREVVRRLEDKVREINQSGILPAGLQIVPYYDRSEIVQQSTITVAKALLEGAVLVLFVVYVFLRNFRSSLLILITLPLSLLLTFAIMRHTGLDANLMSLGGLAISIGMIIDATIIQVENVQRRLNESDAAEPRLPLILDAVLQVRKPSLMGELIIALTFLPILTLQGLEGKMFAPLALTVMIALFSSLLISIFIVPVLCLAFLRPHQHGTLNFMVALSERYHRFLAASFKRFKWFACAAVALLAITLFLLTNLGSEFMPIMDEGAFDMDVQLLPGVNLAQAMATISLVEKKLTKFPELESVVGRIGQTGLALEVRGVEKTGFVGIFKPSSEWQTARHKDEIIEQMRLALADIPGMSFGFSQPIQCRIDELVAGTRSQLILKLFGHDLDILAAKVNQIASILKKMPGATDVVVEQTTGQNYLTIQVDRERIAQYGLNVDEVLQAVRVAVGGEAVTQLYEENRSFDVVVRYPERYRNSENSIGRILVSGDNGINIPLELVAAVRTGEGPMQISHEDGMRRMAVELNIQNRDIGGFVAEAKKRIKEQVTFPPGYYTAWGGQFENQQRAMKKLSVIGPLVVFLIWALLYSTFKSGKITFLIMLNLPFALVGGVLALAVFGLYLSVPASIGFIVLFGVAVLNGMVLVAHFSSLQGQGYAVEAAVLQGSRDRLRPVLMTACITIFTLIPMLFATGPGSEIQKPLAVVVMGGLFSSTLLTLILLPLVYRAFMRE